MKYSINIPLKHYLSGFTTPTITPPFPFHIIFQSQSPHHLVANPNKRLDLNVEGEFYVDTTCINCDTCRQLAPTVFSEGNDYSYVYRQPETPVEIKHAMQAVIACPTGSIGHGTERDRRTSRSHFPIQLDTTLFYLGFHSPASYGGASYYVRLNDQGWMIDSPRYTPYLVDKLTELGGVDYIFLTHRDDVAAADRYAEAFDAQRIIHHDDRSAQPDAEIIIRGTDDQEIAEGFVIIPTPGHTKGHIVLLVDDRYLFTGDHLYWKDDWDGLRATRRMNWYSWPKQKKSLKKLLDYDFEWVLPGHGRRMKLATDSMHNKLVELIEKVESPDYW